MSDAVIIEVAILILKNTSSVRVKRLGLIPSVFITCDVKFEGSRDTSPRKHLHPLFYSVHMQHVKGHVVGGDEFRGHADARRS